MKLRLCADTESKVRMLAAFKDQIPHSLIVDIVEMYLLEHKGTVERATAWAKTRSKRRI